VNGGGGEEAAAPHYKGISRKMTLKVYEKSNKMSSVLNYFVVK
jgi:hypothetical protein